MALPFRIEAIHSPGMQIHASCAARDGSGVLLLGPPGSGKSDLLLRLLDRGFDLVADDQVDIVGGLARVPSALAGLLEVRGLGIVELPYRPEAHLRLAVRLRGGEPDHADPVGRLPLPLRHDSPDLPMIVLHAGLASAAQRVALALDCVLGRVTQRAGAFA